MEPLAVLRTIWKQRWFAVPAILITVAAAVLVYAFGPRDYESSVSYALVNPTVPTEEEIAADPSLKDLNSDNPYLRSSDPNLIASVVITRLNAPDTADRLKSMGLGTEFLASPGTGAGLIVTISATGSTQKQSLATVNELSRLFEQNLRQIQTVNGADDRFLFTSIVVAEPDRATEKLSSRVRTVIVVVLGGLLLVFGAISLGTWVDAMRRRRESAIEQTEPAIASTSGRAKSSPPAGRNAGSASSGRPAADLSKGQHPQRRTGKRT